MDENEKYLEETIVDHIISLLNDKLGERYLFVYNPETDKRKVALIVPEESKRDNVKNVEYTCEFDLNGENAIELITGEISFISDKILRDFCVIGAERTALPRITLIKDGVSLSNNSITIKVGFLLRGEKE